jgi:hypothetical protein
VERPAPVERRMPSGSRTLPAASTRVAYTRGARRIRSSVQATSEISPFDATDGVCWSPEAT